MTSTSHIAYRADIDGLRAIAVLSVIGFHGFPSVARGGYVGVDIFFVISGYLISGIILKDLDAGTFKFWDFYARRIRRIFPALIIVLAACLAIGWYVLIADDYQQLGKHVAVGAAFASNIQMWREQGYFDRLSELKPLLHLWSLGVEEQFYIIWPLFLWLAWRIRRWLPLLIIAVAAGSFFLNVSAVDDHAIATFFLPFTRFWQLLCGALLAYAGLRANDAGDTPGVPGRLRRLLAALSQTNHFRHWANLVSLAGASLLLLAVFGLDRNTNYPGWPAVVPTCGALLLIYAGERAWINRTVLSRRALVSVGLISYPLYLWHWPLLVFARVVGRPWRHVVIMLIALSVFLAWATYRFVEVPIRVRKRNRRTEARLIQVLAAVLACIFLCGVGVWRMVLPGRLDAFARNLVVARSDWSYPGDGVVGAQGAGTILFMGDSYMQQYYPRIKELSRSGPWADKTIVFKAKSGCAPIPDIERRGRDCNSWVREGYSFADRDEVETIVLGASWFGLLSRGDQFRVDNRRSILNLRSPETDWVFVRFEEQLRTWVQKKKRVYVILEQPFGNEADPSGMIEDRLAWTPRNTHRNLSLAKHRKSTDFIDNKIRRIAGNVGAAVIDPPQWLCVQDVCATVSAAGTPIYKDATHLRASFVRSEVRYLDAIAE